VVCRSSSGKRFLSKAEMVRHVLSVHRLSPDGCVFIGDTAEDYEAAAAAGVSSVLVKHGYGYSQESESIPQCQWIATFPQLNSILEIRSSA
jgi:phosphoglycolate phosphatase